MPKAEQRSETDEEDEQSFPIVDCDLHVLTDGEAIVERMSEPFRFKGLSTPSDGTTSPIGYVRRDAVPDEASQLELTREQVLDPLGVEHIIVTGGPVGGVTVHPNAPYAAAIARAYNEWIIEEWTEKDERIHASIAITPQAPEAAVEEIHRWSDHPDMVQVIMWGGTQMPLGQRDYWPIFEAAEKAGLPIGIHVGPRGKAGITHPNNPGGPSSNYTESHIAGAITYYGQVASLVFEGVFEEFPDLKFALIEGEFGWVPDLMWRMDRNWKQHREEVPWLNRPPSEYVLDNLRFTTQPIPEPPRTEYLLDLLEMIHAEETLMFCTDYPHWDGDYSPHQVFPNIPESMERAIFFETANELYGF